MADGGGQAHEPAPQIALPGMLTVAIGSGGSMQKRWKTTPLQLQEARTKRSLAVRDQRVKKEARRADQKEFDLRDIVAHFPGVAQLVGQKSCAAVGRRRNVEPRDFRYLALALHLPLSVKLNVGVNRARLLLAGRRLLLQRQTEGFANMVRNATKAREVHSDAHALWMSCVFSHEWDETSSKYKYFGSTARLGSKMGIFVQVMQQRGTLHLQCRSELLAKQFSWSEEWLCPAMVVHSTKARELEPALSRHLPSWVAPTAHPDVLRQTLQAFHSVVFAPIGDAASGNLLLMKAWQHRIETKLRPLLGCIMNRYLFLPDSCQAHSHQRGRASLRNLRFHTSRHCSLARLLRFESHLEGISRSIVASIRRRLKRVADRSPTLEIQSRLMNALRFLYDLDKSTQNQKGVEPPFIRDLRALPDLINDDTTSDTWEHFCKMDESGATCCADDDACVDKIVGLLLRVLYGRSEQIPGQEKWTYMMKAFKRSLLRKMIHECGVLDKSMFRCKEVPDVVAAMDEEPNEELLRSIRISRACDYQAVDTHWHELAMHTIVVKVTDDLFYTLLGGVDKAVPPMKISALLNRTESPIKRCLEALLALISGGFSDPNHEVWCIVHLVKAPTGSPEYRKFCLGQVLRSNSFVTRRYVQKYARDPFSLNRLVSDDWSGESKLAVVRSVLRAQACCLHVFTRNFRELFSSEVAMMSGVAVACASQALDAMRVVTDFSERSHAEFRCHSRSMTGPRSFPMTSNEALLRQVATVHRRRGGLTLEQVRRELAHSDRIGETETHPLLRTPSASLQDGAVGGAAVGEPPDRVGMDVGADGTLGQVDSDPSGDARDALPHECLAPAHALGVGGAEGQLVDRSAASGPLESLMAPRRHVEQGQPTSARDADAALVGPRRGLNPKLFHTNKMLAAAKRASPTGKLTEEEVQSTKQHASEKWDSMSAQVRSLWVSQFAEWQQAPVDEVAARPHTRYLSHWAGGSRRGIVSELDFWRHHRQHGWPTDLEVHHNPAEHRAQSTDCDLDFSAATQCNLFGCLRQPRNICPLGLRDAPTLELADSSLGHWVDLIGKTKADAGTAMTLVRGWHPPGELGEERCRNFVQILSGTCYNPKVSDWTPCSFGTHQLAESPVLDLLVDVIIDTMVGELTENGQVIRSLTSSEFLSSLTETFDFVKIELWDAEYQVLEREGGDLMHLRIDRLNQVGLLWEIGAIAPPIRPAPKPRPQPKLLSGNPFDQPCPGRGCGGPRGQGRGGSGTAGRGRGRGRARGRASEDAVHPRVPAETLGAASGGPPLAIADALDNSGGSDSDTEMTDGAIDELSFLDEDVVQEDIVGGVEDDVLSRWLEAEMFEAGDIVAGADSPDPPPPPLAAPPPPPLVVGSMDDIVLYPSGRVYLREIQIGSIVRGKPKGAISARCSLHSKCTWVLPLRLAPPDETILEWFLKVPRKLPTDSPEEGRRKTAQHLALAHVWRECMPIAAASSSG